MKNSPIEKRSKLSVLPTRVFALFWICVFISFSLAGCAKHESQQQSIQEFEQLLTEATELREQVAALSEGSSKEQTNIKNEDADASAVKPLLQPEDQDVHESSEPPVSLHDTITSTPSDDEADESTDTDDESAQIVPQSLEMNDETITVGMKNALRAAEKRLGYGACSYDTLLKRLVENDKYKTEEATYAIEQLNVDWNAQAIEMAKKRLEMGFYSRNKLLKRLVETDRFKEEEAIYAISQLNIDWKEQAVGSAEKRLAASAYSRETLLKRLVENDEYTEEQAVYALQRVYD